MDDNVLSDPFREKGLTNANNSKKGLKPKTLNLIRLTLSTYLKKVIREEEVKRVRKKKAAPLKRLKEAA